MIYYSTKTYPASIGLSCCFRQHGADSHCSTLHGYALEVKITFAAHELDERNWVVDFGDMKTVKDWLVNMFDHTCLVARSDPQFAEFSEMHEKGLIDMRVVEHVGCEAFAQMTYEHVKAWLTTGRYWQRVWVKSVEVREHGANSAIYESVE